MSNSQDNSSDASQKLVLFNENALHGMYEIINMPEFQVYSSEFHAIFRAKYDFLFGLCNYHPQNDLLSSAFVQYIGPYLPQLHQYPSVVQVGLLPANILHPNVDHAIAKMILNLATKYVVTASVFNIIDLERNMAVNHSASVEETNRAIMNIMTLISIFSPYLGMTGLQQQTPNVDGSVPLGDEPAMRPIMHLSGFIKGLAALDTTELSRIEMFMKVAQPMMQSINVKKSGLEAMNMLSNNPEISTMITALASATSEQMAQEDDQINE